MIIVLGKLIRDNQQFNSHDTRPETKVLSHCFLTCHLPLATCHWPLAWEKRRVKLKTMPAIK